jgi:hypothetical protein
VNGCSPGLPSGEAGFQTRLKAPAEIEGFSPGVCILLNADRDFEPARELGFVSGHDLSRAETK